MMFLVEFQKFVVHVNAPNAEKAKRLALKATRHFSQKPKPPLRLKDVLSVTCPSAG